MEYLKAEYLKFKRSLLNRLLWIAPLLTAVFAWMLGGFYGFQYMTFYWWYAFLLPGTIAILCFLSLQKEVAGSYCMVLAMPVCLVRFELAKTIVIAAKLLISALYLALLVSVSNMLSPSLAVYSLGRSVIGSLAIILASIWQIPVCMYLVRRVGMLLPVFINAVLGISLPVILGRTAFALICPYCWAAKLAEPLMGIELNGTFSGKVYFSWVILLMVFLSVMLFLILSFGEARSFSHREGK